ncbi:methylcytosine dioxygenase TET2-like [Conger conger]|uniref:methylcytosine dioxygenase TET2-like n=1 Tax=Conger conger TaxID=82655 RepID=UPI002A5B004D|nr:methylcytosine dioxygenase TET2-like [Conger conger]
METEKAGQETEEGLTPAPPNAVHQSENLIGKLQNGSQSPVAFPQQTNGDVDCNPFKPNEGVNPVKSHGEKCPSPAGMQDLHPRNGGMKHALSEPSLLGFYQSKKLRLDPEINGQDDSVTPSRETAKSDSTASKLDSFPDLAKPSALEGDGLQTQKLDNNKCNFSDEDLYSLPRNKKLAFTNGAIVNSPSMEDMHSDLLEKTLSQYYPDHISVASQNTCKDDSSKNPVSNDMPEENTDSPILSSGLPVSSPNSLSGQQEKTRSEEYSGDGHATLGTDEEQPQGQRFPLKDALMPQDPCSRVDEGSQPVSPADSGNGQNSPGGSSKALIMNPHSDEAVAEKSRTRSPLQTQESERVSHFTNDNTEAVVEDKDPDLSNSSKVLNPNLNSQLSPEKVQVDVEQQTQVVDTPENYSQEGTPGPGSSNPVELSEGPPNQQPENHLTEYHAKGKNETDDQVTFEGEAEEMLQQTDPYPEVNWTDPNSSQPSREMGLTQAEPEQQADVQSQSQMQNLGPMQGFQKQDSNQSSFQQQEKETPNLYKPELAPGQVGCSSMPESQQLYPEPSQIPTPHKELIQSNKSQPLSQQYGIPQHQVENQFHTQMQHEHSLEGTQDIEQILESGYSHQQPMPTPQSESQIVSNALQHPPSQNLQSMGEPKDQLQDSSERQLNCQVLNRFKLEEDMRLERELKSSNSKPQNHQVQHQTGLNATARASPGFLDSSMPEVQTQQDAMFPYSHSEVHEDCGMKTTAKIPQLQYSQSTVTQKQYSQQHFIQPKLNHMEFPQPPPPPMYQPSQVSQGACNQQPSVQMYPTSESQKMFGAQLHQGHLQNQNNREFQRYAALRMHLLQKQEKQGHQQNLDDFKHILQAIERERGSRAEPQPGKEPSTPAMQTVIKQEYPQMTCEQTQHKSIIATMEQQLKQYELSPVFERKSLVMRTPPKVKVETSGPVTILSTNANLDGEDFGAATQSDSTSELTPTRKMEPNLHSFLESPLKLLDTPIKKLFDTPVKTQYEIPSCHCVEQISEKDEGPYYTHLGAAPNITGIRELMEKRFGQSGSCIRIEKVVYTGKEGKSSLGCPIAKWVIRRPSEEEKVVVLVRERAGHTCETAAIVVVILLWEGIPPSMADRLYTDLSDTLQRYGALTNRRCAFNEERTCACQGLDPDTCGASFSFGCSWSMYYNGCKFARSKIPRKFRILGDDHKEEEKVEQHLQNLATLVAPKYKQMAPDAYANQVEYEHRAPDCRLGLKEGRPFSGVTACMDFCAHAHRDLHNMPSGSTVVCTLTRDDNRGIGKIPEDEQLHVLPLYKVSSTDEFGSVEGQQEKIKSGAIQVLSTFRRKVRMLDEPAKSCRQRKLEGKRGGANKDTPNSKAEKTPPATQKQSTLEKPGQNIDVSGSQPGKLQMEAAQLGHPPHPLSSQYLQQQQLRSPNPSPGSPHLSQQSYQRFPNAANPFSSTSQSSLCPQSPAPMSPHPSSLQANAYLNGASTVNSYHGSLNPNSAYPGYQCNGSIPRDSFHPYYASSQKHMDVYPHQRPQLCTEQQYHPQQHYRFDYPPRYHEPGLHVNGYSNSNMRPNVHPMGPYSTYSPNNGPDSQLLETVSRSPSAHPTMDYAAVSKSGEYNGYPNPYVSQNSHMYLQDKDCFRTPIKRELNFHDVNGMGQVLPPMGTECPTPIQPGHGLPNESIQGITIKQESHPEAQTPTKKEEVWSDNEHSFLDPEIGGVAVAPSHGSILIECAKRELHATTPLQNPDRNRPTRISLVFYQHKNLIEAKHGLALWEAKMAEKNREKELDIEKYGAEVTPTKNKKVKRELPEVLESSEPPYKRFIETLSAKSSSCTTNTYVSTSPYAFTKVTGPYNHYV